MKPRFQGFSATNGVERVERECHQQGDGVIVAANQCETPPSGTHSTEGGGHTYGLSHSEYTTSSGGGGSHVHQHLQESLLVHHEHQEGLGGSADKKSQYRGVSYDRKKAKWRVQIKVAALGKSGVSVGYFDTEESAARAYDRAAIGLLGRTAPQLQTNFAVIEYEDESIPDLSGKTREEVKTALKSERIKQAPRRRFVSRQRTSQFMGVGSSNRKNQWQARILVHGKVTHLGYYQTEEDAARVYDRVSLALHGNAAQTNFPFEEYPEEEIKPFTGLDRESLQRALGVKPMDKSSRYRGVSKKKGKWEAKVMVNRRWAYRELFDSEEAAARAYDRALWRLKPTEAASYVNFKDEACGMDVAGSSAPRAARSIESADYEDEYPVGEGYDRDHADGEDACDGFYSSDGEFEYEYKPTKGTSRSEAMRANKASAAKERESREMLSLRKAAPAPVRTKKVETKPENKSMQPKFALVPGEGMKFVTSSAAGTSLESASTPLGDTGMIPNLSTSSFHDQNDLMIRVGSETHLVPPSSNALPMHNDPCVSRRHAREHIGGARLSHPAPARLRGAGMKRTTSEPYIPSLHEMEDPLVGMDDFMNDPDVLDGKGIDLGLLTGSNGVDAMGVDTLGGIGNIMDQDLLQIQNFVHDQEVADAVGSSHAGPQVGPHSHLVFDEAEETALHGLEFHPKPRKLSKSVSMTNLACEDISDAAATVSGRPCGVNRAPFHPGKVASTNTTGRPPTMPYIPHTHSAALGLTMNGSGNNTPSGGLRRVNTFTCSLPSLDEVEMDQTPRLRASSHNSSDEDLVKQLWAGEAHIPSLHI